MKKIISVLLAVLLLTSAFSLTAFADEAAQAFVISEDGNYTIDASFNTPVDIVGAKATVTLDNANIQADLQQFERSAIKVSGGADVTFVLEGFSTIAGSSNKTSCGIEVALDSKVSFEGEGTLNITGGKYGAAIGSYGTGINLPVEERVQVGEITINSGNINAYGGERGSGIGAGYHVSGNKITINDGTVRAYAGAMGAGIGCGYGTSGGAIGVAAVGDYTAGTIIINGGDIYAASSWTDFSDFSSFDAINANEVAGAWGVGIGGGYGASVDLIEINGGKVVAVSGASGAAIGTGRGTSKGNQYNIDTYRCNIKIGGDADVTAVTSDVTKDGDHLGGAAIGTGRGCHTGGTIEITDNAKVVAINAGNAPAIGSSKKNSPVDGAIPVAESIIIGDNVQLYAVSAADYAVDKDASTLSINDKYFGSSDRWFFGEDAVAISDIENVKVESTKGEMMYTAPAGSVSLWSRIVPQSDDGGETIKTSNLGIVTPLAMAVRFEDGGVYYSGDSLEVELDKDYHFQMCSVDWSTRSINEEKKIHKPYETFYPAETASQHVNHGIYSDDGLGLCGTVVYTVRVSSDATRMSFDEATKTFVLPLHDSVLRTDVNKCFMAYRFTFQSGDYNKQTGIDNVVYDTGIEHENTLEDFRYTKPLEFLSVNLPLGSTVTAKAYNNYEYFAQADVFVEIDAENPEECYTDYVWPY
ncbi:MAG: hypothetical protein IJH40_08905 [Ruminococcus sp.]|uniref:hypothetical protein n=1 Tax=Ruminococcus sp. TaxID=41978 RepID=UPI0028736686|nr:hypothetical protein [Ruminococcus sp.]MBQ3285742.1 hypothetical protein [Ruminococcus sp.]